MDFLEYNDISSEIKGLLTPGRLKLTDQNIIFKNSRTGKVEQISASDIELVNFQYFVNSLGLRVFLKNDTLHRFVGFKESEKDKLAKFFSTTYKKDMLEKELNLKGWNWGTAKFEGSVVSFENSNKMMFEVPLNYVSQCNAGKNEVTMEFHQNDDAPVSLMEMRFYIPSSELAGDVDPVEAFQQQVMNKASVISVSGDAIAILRDIQCLTPRGRYDFKIFQTFFQLHGKTFDYKIPMSTVLRLFLLPHKDNRQMFFVISLDPPIKQGQTRYHFLVLLFRPEDETEISLPFTEEELKEKYDNKLEKDLSGPTYEVMGKIMKSIINIKLTGPGSFVGHSQTPAVSCSFKAAAGFLYPLERGFVYVHKPPIHIRFEEVATVNFARSGGSNRSFDFEIELKSGTTHTFSSIEKEEYGKLFDFITSKKLHVKNRGKNDKSNYMDDFGDSDNEGAPDAYLERVKAEAQEREDDESDDDESTDSDFNPDEQQSDVAEEFNSEPETTSEEESGADDKESGNDTKKKMKKHKKEKSAKTISEKPRKQRNKKEKDSNKPKRAVSAYMIWLNEKREEIKKANPGIKVTEIAKKGGEMWKELKDKSEWEKKAAKAKEEYEEAMKEYKANLGEASKGEKSSLSTKGEKKKEKSGKSSSTDKKKAAVSPIAKGPYKSKEYISDDDSSSSEEEKKKSSPPKRKKESSSEKNTKKRKAKESGSDNNSSSNEKNKKKKKKDESESEAESSGAISGGSDSD